MRDKFSNATDQVLSLAEGHAQRFNHPYVGPEHLLLGLADHAQGAAARVLRDNGASVETLHERVHFILGESEPRPATKLPTTPQASEVLRAATRQAGHRGDPTVEPAHILLALLDQTSRNLSVDILLSLGLDPAALRSELLKAMATDAPTELPSTAVEPTAFKPAGSQLLDQFGVNLTREAAEGKLDPVIGRDAEIRRLTQVLSRRMKNNPVLLGDAGVGKTAIVEGLARNIVDRAVPPSLTDKQLYAIDLASMVAGSRYRGDFEERLKGVLKEVLGRGDIIVFIDEVHMLVGAGAAEGSIDAANILKPLLSRGEMKLIGATTHGEYRKSLEKDSALDRRFQRISVNEPAPTHAVAILSGLKPLFEAHHQVTIADTALQAAVDLSCRYLPTRFLPDKAIDLIDEAAAEVALRLDPTSTVVVADDVATVVSQQTGVPVSTMSRGESQRLGQMAERLHRRVVGMDEAIQAVSKAIKRARTGIRDPHRPAGSFVFAGPTGVGKTELAKALAEFLFDDQDNLVRFDMSEFGESHTASRLVGSPPGYVGHDEGGQLTERVRRKPFSVVLFDEVEKAHTDVLDTLLQVLDDGQLTDSAGRRVDFTNTVIILTTNLGSRDLARDRLGFGESDSSHRYEHQKNVVSAELRQHFRPEFLNRFDDIIVFPELSRDDILAIVGLLVNDLDDRLGANNISIEVTAAARERLADYGHNPAEGARQLRRAIQAHIEDPLTEMVLNERVEAGQTVRIDTDADSGKLTLTPLSPCDGDPSLAADGKVSVEANGGLDPDHSPTDRVTDRTVDGPNGHKVSSN
ncbi:ATP-dependent Clp protease ATP-binding subunit [Streptomyces spectabilis]|uniref:ATP-dependent Clp protease ATP-binding subunit n=1 Tax=Streptomyces spectabilis TaxID=68270 RepID=A0A5P2X5Y6_STRST|nr:ATP-dependent Clp protease ATP-binding subunit [Streptomyces spectabilis]MBB5101014.1 ATP-dependent Clp protease ATP-binding subunit ClpC [Streptomyces spectabilis]MCI3900226.1 ATP-dependent Clp protease ATP-binding subunit [Streptomyces spectabilis]QEV57832.1 ATP-dependent Clp protease ATP-binding subunit [Streptomyces spectabilis]GGV08983.1 chaperone protein ClpB [Streptomyces spectabilis]